MSTADAGLDATAQAELLQRNEVSGVELVDAAIARIEKGNRTLNAVIYDRFDEARREGGIPILVKDLACEVRGLPAAMGNATLKARNRIGDHDSGWVTKLRAAGFAILGKTNTPEFGLTPTTEPTAFGATRNPWDLDCSAGGSSGGSAAAVAAGMTAVAHGTDGGGSVRIPAANCGLVGIKPTRGRISLGPDAGEGWMGASTSGPLARSVRDAAWLLDVLSGPQPGDPYAAPALPGPLRAEVTQRPGVLRVGFLDHPARAGVAASAEPAAAVHRAVELLEGYGHQVAAAHPDAFGDPDFALHFARVVAVGTATRMHDMGLGDDDVEPATASFASFGRSTTGVEYLSTVSWMHAFSRRMARWWTDGFDVLVTPVLNGPPPRLGELADVAKLVELLQYTPQFNITGQPAISLPLYWTPAGLPIGVQFVGAYGREDVLVRLAAQLEPAFPPPLALATD